MSAIILSLCAAESSVPSSQYTFSAPLGAAPLGALAEVSPRAPILGKTSWRKLVRRICPHDSDFEEALVRNKKRMLVLADILKMAEEPKPLLLDLLHVICERFPPLKRAHLLRLEVPGPEFIEVSCSCELISHSVQPCGFSLLEAVEAALGT